MYQTIKPPLCFSDLSPKGPGSTAPPVVIIPDTLCAFCKNYNSMSPQHATTCQEILCAKNTPFQQQDFGALGRVFAPLNQPTLRPTEVKFGRK